MQYNTVVNYLWKKVKMNENKDVPIRDAATVILLRQKKDSTYVLMGQRGNKAAFMPSKYVFPGGAVDEDDANVELFKSINKKGIDLLHQFSEKKIADHPIQFYAATKRANELMAHSYSYLYKLETIIKWADELIGKNSDIPWTADKIRISIKSRSI